MTQDSKLMALASKAAGEIDAMIDDFVVSDKNPNFAAALKMHSITAAAAKLIPAMYEKTIAELQEVLLGKDEQLVEGYSNFSKPKIRKLLKHYESIAEVCAQQEVSSKKTRSKKEKPASVVAKMVKHMRSFKDLELVSERPEKIVGASEVRIFNTKYNTVQVYRAEKNQTLSVKGTTIVGYSIADSFGKGVRQVELAKQFAGMTKKTFDQAVGSIKSKQQKVNGRINQHCVILKAS
jgi:hypothetical protein